MLSYFGRSRDGRRKRVSGISPSGAAFRIAALFPQAVEADCFPGCLGSELLEIYVHLLKIL
jgi:hypothetical protein